MKQKKNVWKKEFNKFRYLSKQWLGRRKYSVLFNAALASFLSIGVVSGASISGFVWEDSNKNGNREVSEPELSGARVKLYFDQNRDGLPARFVGSTQTDQSGAYSFDNLPVGSYAVMIDMESLPEKYYQVTQQSSSGNGNDVDPNILRTPPIVFSGASGSQQALIGILPGDNEVRYHGVVQNTNFANGVDSAQCWDYQNIAFYFLSENGVEVPLEDATRWIKWYQRMDLYYQEYMQKRNYLSRNRLSWLNPTTGVRSPKREVAFVSNSCGVGCGNGQSAETTGFRPQALSDPENHAIHWVLFYEMGRGGAADTPWDRKAIWPLQAVNLPHLMGAVSFYKFGGGERGIYDVTPDGFSPARFLENIGNWERNNGNYLNVFNDNYDNSTLVVGDSRFDSYGFTNSVLLTALVDFGEEKMVEILSNMSAKNIASNAFHAAANFKISVSDALDGVYDADMESWGYPTNAQAYSIVNQTTPSPADFSKAPVISNLKANAALATSVNLDFDLDDGLSPTRVVVYYGSSDGGTDPSKWDSSFDFEWESPEAGGKRLEGLMGNTAYYCAVFASNKNGTSWSNSVNFTTEAVYRWDLGAAESRVATGYEQLTNLTSSGAASWTNTAGIQSRDRLQAGDLYRDFVFSSATRTLRHQLPNGSYEVSMNMWDALNRQGAMTVKANGVTKVSGLTTDSANNPTQTFTAMVSNGFLDLEFSSTGNWILNQLVISPIGGRPFGGTARSITSKIEAEDYNTGGQGVAYNDTDPTNNGGQGRTSEGVDIENTTDTGGGANVGWVANGEWLEYNVNAQAGTYTIEVRTASSLANPGDVQLSLNGTNLGTVAVGGTGGWQTWETSTLTNITVPAVTNGTLRLTAVGGGFNINWFRFVADTPPPTGNGTPFGGAARAVPGTIQAEDFNVGGQGVAYSDNDVSNNGGSTYRSGESVDVFEGNATDPARAIGWIANGEFLNYGVNVTPGTFNVTARVASNVANPGDLNLTIDGIDLGTFTVENTGGWRAFQEVTFQT